MSDAPTRTTRLAPSPTGALHLGNARTFLLNWAIALQRGWRIALRIDDLDGPRVKAGADRGALEDLRWLGLDWDGQPLYESADLSPYSAALARLSEAGAIYPCTCTRREIEQAQSAPHGDEHELRYPGTCRGKTGGDVQTVAWRVIVPDEPIAFTDQLHGPQTVNVQQQVGDFIVATKASLPSYQLAVVIDDARQGVTDVVRGDDLLASTARQILLYRLLQITPLPTYWHLPLVLGPDGRRLAKRHGDTRLAWYREAGVKPERIVGLIAFWSGIRNERAPMTAQAFLSAFDLDRLSRESTIFSQEDHRWLLEN